MKTEEEHQAMIELARTMRAKGESFDFILECLRQMGASQADSLVVLIKLGFTMGQSKEMVHLSRTWADTREATERFWDMAIEELHKDASEES